ncbi:P-loop containing nucleoside triphosphate hydrolase protein [Rhodocollybia butyracea]|uniref:Structural maintenance of chromosomes protein 5 n=1 Tax=Rhodocollybia butyracea TaxID=206335 RepID=A0A9P5UE89_9AGAR|nr:P-loop containing nucleoside triphosphate hydrolase protein [Rhodocollybia butyracea]
MKGNLVNGAVKVKMEKVKEQQAKVNGEQVKAAKARVDEEESDAHDDVDASEDEDDEEGSGSPKGRKRARANTNGDSRPSQSQNGAEAEGTTPRTETLPRDEEDGFIPGSITRIQLRNFVTYDFVEFAPGPYLNMIIGPNGTGKSSIACAIALGLNFPPKVLGRAEEIFAFVKNGTSDGHIEIELKSMPGKPNLVIRRKLVANSKTSTFMLNGKNATGKEVSIKMAELGVQVGNLCSFLPQDKVSQFAMMSPQQLLKETQKAAGDTNLTSWHESLIDAGKENRVMKEKIESEQSQLAQMHARNAAIENEVERYNERKKIEETIAMLEVYIPSATYRELLARYGELKEVQRKMHQRVLRLKAKNEPAHALLNRLRSDLKDLEKKRETRKKDTQKLFQEIKKLHSMDEELENLSETHYSKLEHLTQAERERQQQIRDLEGKIQRMEEELNAPLPDEVKQVLEDADGSIKKEKRNKIANRRDDLGNQLKYKIEEKAVSRFSIRQLDSVEHQKLQAMQRFSRDTADAIKWIRDNKAHFRMEIIEPALLTLTVPDRRYQAAVENVLSGSNFKTFVAQCQEDYDLLNELINDKGALGRKAQISTWFRDPNNFQIHPPPMTPEEMQELGFDGFLADFVSAPPAMIWFLKNEASLHRIAMALKPNSVNVQRASDLVKRSGGSTFIVGTVVNSIRRSKYGTKAATNTTSDLKPARLLAAHTVDNDVKRGFEQTIKRLKVDVSAKEDEISMLKDEGRKIEAEAKALDEKAVTRERTILKQKKSVPSADQERLEIRTQLVNLAKKRLKIVKEYTTHSKKVVLEQQETTRLGLQYLQVNANRAALETLCEKKDEKYNRAMDEFRKIDDEYNEVKKLSKEALNESRDALNNTTDEIREKYKEEIQIKRAEYDAALKVAEANGTTPPSSEGVDLRTADEYRAELDAQEAQLELVSKTQPGVIEQYEKRKRDIEVLERTLEERQRNASKVERGIKSTLDRWKPALEKLVSSIGQKFSAAFDRIGCAGEIRISENEDYDKWAIDILVKFRDEEKLQLLTGQRQSGGERSLTTILYLMSLTEEARAPFSLVDEINQGMDQRAERVVHDNMVDVTCKDDSSQYFLITPKLLPDLKYHERMKILCVNNGEWLPEETRVGNLMNLIEGFVSNKRNRAANVQ